MIREINIENLKCGGCANTIKNGLSEIKGVDNINVNVEDSKVLFHAPDTLVEKVKDKLSKLGYPEVGDENNLLHKAKSFVSCAVGRIKS
ncbi:heavy-metal-associated domain-containing protein [Tenacibaculum sp. MEBiC06402]|uniref:heavy-metal-associated domain-containing protein n=1 Tax=unclassified Tenacibaculum TaxID=2635139 RepID=UPI003B9D1E5B